MRRALVLFILAVAACAKTEKPAADTTTMTPTMTPAAPPPAPPPAVVTPASWAGTWEGTAMPMNKDTVVTTLEMTATATKTGWKMKLPNGANPAVKVTYQAGDSVVTDAGPFASAVRKGQRVTIHSIFHLVDGKVVGLTHAKYSKGDTTTLRISATKKAGP